MAIEVQVKHVDPLPIAVVRRRALQDQLSSVVPKACGEVWEFIRASNIPHSGLNMALYWDGDINLDCGVIVLQPFTSSGPVVCAATPGGLVASVAHFGPYDRLGDAHRAIIDWSRRPTGPYHLAGPSWEIYDHWNDDPSKLRTDVFYLLAGDSSPDVA